MKIFELRCSSLPMLRRCSASLSVLSRDEDQPAKAIPDLDPWNPASSVGTAVHSLLAACVEDRDEDVEAACHSAGVDEGDVGEVEYLAFMGRRIWHDHLKRHFSHPLTVESRITRDFESRDGNILRLSGQVDVACTNPNNWAEIVDWKSGRIEGDYEDQLRGYALLRCLKDNLPGCRAWVVFLRSGRYRLYEWTLDELTAWCQSKLVPVLAKATPCAGCSRAVR